ncbi:SAM-dependent methyltransferase [Rhabdochromatium marinum]|nr:class I SAM-dependent methyltransferase [Rhabdochromatium marinum]MBK1650539.1 SAM-dependent methyltransferase [Rhabdochromatium marinum]
MFSLSSDELGKKILGCGDGPACFNSELYANGGNVVSVDPIYKFSAVQIQSRIEEVYLQIMDQVSRNKENYVWKNIRDVKELGEVRMEAMRAFLSDYGNAQQTRRYINASLPTLPFKNAEFDLALCSHYLFLYSDHVDQQQHVDSMHELCRVAKEVRVYPLLSMRNNKISKHLTPVMEALEKGGINVSLAPVKYEFQKGATEMLLAKNV